MLAVSAMDPTLTFIFFAAAFVLFLVAAIVNRAALGWLVPAGLACWMLVLAWDALAAT